MYISAVWLADRDRTGGCSAWHRGGDLGVVIDCELRGSIIGEPDRSDAGEVSAGDCHAAADCSAGRIDTTDGRTTG